MRVYYDNDCDLSLIGARRVAVIGYGAQGHAHALNLRDSGVGDIVVALHQGAESAARAHEDGFIVVDVAEAARECDVLMVCAPDETQPEVYARDIAPHMGRGKMLLFAHGFAVHFGFIAAPAEIDVAMVAPKGPGKALRDVFTRGGGLPAIVAVAQDASGHAMALAKSYGAALGCGRAGLIEFELPVGDRGRSLWRAGGALRRALTPDPRRVGSAGGGWLASGAGLFRLPA